MANLFELPEIITLAGQKLDATTVAADGCSTPSNGCDCGGGTDNGCGGGGGDSNGCSGGGGDILV